MKDSLRNYLDNLNYTNIDEFVSSTDSKFVTNKEVKKVTVDLSWIEKIEKAIPYLDNIIRNPRRFIVQEEDIVNVEKAKVVTKETVKHLAQHTSYIQGLDEDGTIRPVKVLNVRREETVDLYENRFIYTLIRNLYQFVRVQADIDDLESSIVTTKNFEYVGKTKINNEEVNTKIDINTYKKEILEITKGVKRNNKERILYINEVLSGFMNSNFIRSISSASPVKSPIRKTNVILKDPNFQKALELWEYLEKFQYENPVQEENIKTDETKNINKYNLDFANYVDYNNINENILYENTSEEKIKNYIGALVDELVLKNTLTDNEFKKILFNEIKKAKIKKNKIYMQVKKIYARNITKEESKIIKTLNILRK